MPKKIFIGGLSAVPTTAIEALLAPFGKVVSTEPASTGESNPPEVGGFTAEPGTGVIVTFEDDDAADRAVNELNGYMLDGNPLVLMPLPLRPPPPRLPPDPPPPT